MEKAQAKETQDLKQVAPCHKQSAYVNLLFPKKSWTEQEDRLLAAVVARFGASKWSHIAKYIPNRLGKQCRERWFNHLSPSINRAEWSEEEEWLLFLGHTFLGGKWSKLTKILAGRTDNGIKNHWNSIMRKKTGQLQSRLQREIDLDSIAKTPKNKAAELLKELKVESANELQSLNESEVTPSLVFQPLESALVKSDSSDSLSFTNILRKMDEKDLHSLQRKESYKYCGWRNLSSEKKCSSRSARDARVIHDLEQDGGKMETSKTLADKENRLCQIEDLLEQQEDIPLPLPIKRLSSLEYPPHEQQG